MAMNENIHTRGVLKSECQPSSGNWSDCTGASAAGSDAGPLDKEPQSSPSEQCWEEASCRGAGTAMDGPFSKCPQTPKNSRLLVVEDNIVNQKVLSSMLKQLGFFNVVVAVDGKRALELVIGNEAEQFDLCFMDCLMPVMDGWTATREIRKWEALCQQKARLADSEKDEEQKPHRLTIIALTAHVTMRDRDECLDSGMDDFMVKPVSIEQVQSALMQWLPSTFGALTHGINISEIKRWPRGILNQAQIRSTPLRAVVLPYTRSVTSATQSSGNSSPLEEVGAILRTGLNSQDGELEENIVFPAVVSHRQRRKTHEHSPLLIQSSLLGRSKAKSVTSETGSVNLASLYNVDMMKSAQSLITKQLQGRSPVLEQADLPVSGVSNEILWKWEAMKLSPEDFPSRKKVSLSSPLLESADMTCTYSLKRDAGGEPLPPPPCALTHSGVVKKDSYRNSLASLKTLRSVTINKEGVLVDEKTKS